MAYFDSTKNRALWEIRLAELKKERAAREAGSGTGAGLTQTQPQVKTANPTRVRVSYQQLLQEEAKALAKAKKHEGRGIERRKAPEQKKETEHQKEAGVYEKSR